MALIMNCNIRAGHNVAFLLEDAELYIKNSDTVVNNSYMRISSVKGDKVLLEITLNVMLDINSSLCILSKTYSFNPSVEDNAANFIKQGYEYLKTLPEFAEAIDA